MPIVLRVGRHGSLGAACVVAAGSLANWCDATPLMPPIATAAKAAFMAKFPTVMPIG
ncbi:hypothetical protein YGS_C1P1662 [Sphingobium sp. YG1]|jgi:hypothetical protein|uniref:hypothetical protein n=1 Tax=Sphingobium limneticum TaxID=1007511 RepID=UPI000DBB6466|nr:hypothetical protein YGS_C1P1662 [Sphingobium sp. YG1]